MNPDKYKNTASLAAALGKSRRSIQRHLASGYAPAPTREGHDLQAWQQYFAALDPLDTTEIRELKRRKAVADIEILEIKNAVTDKTLIPIQEIRDRWGYHIGQWQSLLRNKFENELPPLLTGRPEKEQRRMIAEVLDESFRLLKKGEFPEKTASETRKK